MQHASNPSIASKKKPPLTHLRYGIARHHLAWVLCASDEHNWCAVLLGDSQDSLLKDLRLRYPHACIQLGQEALQGALTQILSLLDGRPTQIVPPPLVGTSFQIAVWQALIKIPIGATTTYGAIARKIGRPNAARAVGAACSKNPLAIIVPCHRVLHGAGPKMGYRWGVALKKQLLAQERRIARAANAHAQYP